MEFVFNDVEMDLGDTRGSNRILREGIVAIGGPVLNGDKEKGGKGGRGPTRAWYILMV